MVASASSLFMPHPHDDHIPNAARMCAIGDLLACGQGVAGTVASDQSRRRLPGLTSRR